MTELRFLRMRARTFVKRFTSLGRSLRNSRNYGRMRAKGTSLDSEIQEMVNEARGLTEIEMRRMVSNTTIEMINTCIS